MQLSFRRQDSDAEEMEEEISPNLKLGEIRQAVKTKLGFPEHQPCTLILERTGKKLGDSLTLKKAGVRDNDKLILSPLNTVNTYPKSEKKNDISSATEEKESPSSFNFKAFPTALMVGNMVLVTVVGSLLYLQTIQQQATINEQLEQERSQKFVQDKVDAVAVNTQVNQGYVFLSSKSGKKFTGRVTSSEIRERGNIETSGVAARINWSDGQTSSILFLNNFGVRVWEEGVEYRGKWYWGVNDDLLYVKMDEGAQYKFITSRLYAKRYQKKTRRAPPEQALINYYQTLNNYEYKSAWNSLSSRLQQSTQHHLEGYKSYIDWWTQIARIDVLSTKLVSEDGVNSTVDSRLRYFTKSGREINQTLRFYFIWDTGSNRWLINKVERL